MRKEHLPADDPLTHWLQQSLVGWNDAQASYPRDQCLHHLFEAQAARTPDALALVCGGQQLPYRALNARANHLAHYLQKQGVGPEVLVGICVQRSLEMVIGLLGILKAGGAYVPLDPTYPEDRLAFMLADTGVRFLLTQEWLLEDLPPYAGEVLCLDRDHSLFEWEEKINPRVTTEPGHLAYVVYTSGSTGRPKGVLSHHRGVANYLAYLVNTYGLNGTDVVLQVASLSFDASVRDLIGPLTVGARVVVVNNTEAKDPAALLAKIKEHRVTCLLSIVPTMLNGLIEAACDKDLPYDSIRIILVSGEALYLSTCRKARDVFGQRALVVNQYGPTECTMTSTYHPILGPQDGRDIALIGRPIPHSQVYILDESCHVVPAGVPGELHIGGLGLARGYLNRPELTAEKFIPHPFSTEPGVRLYKTGDLARSLPDGNLEFRGRLDNQVKIGGIRIEPGEIESVLLRHASIKACAVVARDARRAHRNLIAKEGLRTTRIDQGDHRHLVAYIVCRNKLTSAELRNFLEKELPSYMIPAQFIQLDALPLGPNGKLDVKALPEPESLRPELAETFVAPRNPLESLIAEVWQDVLAIDRVGINDSFFDLGGDSLSVLRVLNRLRQASNLHFSFRDLLATQTVAGLAGLIRQAQGGNPAPTLPTPTAVHNEVYPLSLAQRGIWFLWKMEPGSPYYTSQGIIHLRGPLNLPALKRAWQALLERHEILRVRFGVKNGEPVQTFQERQIIDLSVTDLADQSETERQNAVRGASQADIDRAFDLERDPLLRFHLFKLSGSEHALLLTLHEITIDLWSVRVMARDLGALYSGFVQDKESPLSPLTINFSDFVLWENEHVNRPSLKAQESYWRQKLSGELPVLNLPLDRPRPASPSYRGKSKSLLLDTDLSRKLHVLSRQEGTTLFITLLSAFKVLLRVYTGQSDLIIGAPLANRSRQDTEQVVGFFLNMLPLRTDLSGDPSFTELLGRVRETVADAITHADYPFMWMLEWAKAVRDASLSPVFQVMFNMLSFPDLSSQYENLEITYEGLETGYTKYDLSLYAQECGEQIYLQLSYLSDLFDDDTIDRMLRNLVVLLISIVTTPRSPVSTLEILDETERRLLLKDFNDTSKDYKVDRGIRQLFERQAEKTPDRTALIFDGKRLSYAELNIRANLLARYLIGLGVGPETFVAVYTERSLEMMVALLGVIKAGGAYVALDPAHPLLRLHDILRDTSPPILLTQKNLDRFAGYPGKKIYLDEGWELIEKEDPSNPPCSSTAENLLNVVYTSSSTGKPKGTLITIGAVLNRLFWMWDAYPFRSDDVAVLQKSYALVAATWECFGALLQGVPTVILSQQDLLDPAKVWENLVSNKVSYLLASPAFLQGILAQGELHPGHWRTLRLATTSAEPIPPAMVAQWKRVFPRVPLLNLYGATECSSNVTVYDTSRMDPDCGRVPIGKPIANCRVYALNDHLQLVPIGVTGEMCVAGACVARGYLNLPELTTKHFVLDPFFEQPGARLYRTGDLIRYRADGNLELMGRKDDQVKVRGFRVDLGDVEAAVLRHEQVRQCAVTLYGDDVSHKRLVAYVAADENPSTAALRRFLRERLPDYMIPSAFVRLEALPLTPNGKVDRRALPVPAQARPELEGAFVAPRTPVEEVLAGIWSEVLGVKQIGIHDNFFDLGGHSLMATRIISRVIEKFRVELPMKYLLEAPTVADMAAVIEENQAETVSEEDLARMLAELEALSDDEAQRLLSDREP